MKKDEKYNSALEHLLKRGDLKLIHFLNTLPKIQALNKLNLFDVEFLHWFLTEIAVPRQERYLVSLLTLLIDKKKKQKKPHKKIFKQHPRTYTNDIARSGIKGLP